MYVPEWITIPRLAEQCKQQKQTAEALALLRTQ
jgi:hypothetical protein